MHAIDQANILLSETLTEIQLSTLYYYIGNAWSGIRVLRHRKSKTVWDWEQQEIENEILNFRLYNSRSEISKSCYFCQANTNLGNTLSHVGRFIDAVMYWNKALQRNPLFGMALANKGRGLISYAQSLCDNGHRGLFFKFAYTLLKQGLHTNEIYPDIQKGLLRHINNLEAGCGKKFLEEAVDMNNYSLGNSKAEKLYRKWCLNNRLFINPLNDLGGYNIAAQDILTCPSLTQPIDEGGAYPPAYFAFYNQLKQEYVSARYLFYESLQTQNPHYSDKDVLLYNTFDYPCYGLNIEKAKIAFRMAYSVFDKIAYFINEYLKLKVPETKVSFKTIWYNKQKKKSGLRKEFKCLENWPLRGLFWLAKDLSEHRPEFRISIEPDAQDLVNIRNHLEHKYLTVTSEFDMLDIDEADYAQKKIYRIMRDDFYAKILKILKLARAALIYLSLGIQIEEYKKNSKDNGRIGWIPLDIWEDDFKA